MSVMYMYDILNALTQIKNHYHNNVKTDPAIVKIVDKLIFFDNGDVWQMLCNGFYHQLDEKYAQEHIATYDIPWLLKRKGL